MLFTGDQLGLSASAVLSLLLHVECELRTLTETRETLSSVFSLYGAWIMSCVHYIKPERTMRLLIPRDRHSRNVTILWDIKLICVCGNVCCNEVMIIIL
jgi:hypothetical protein